MCFNKTNITFPGAGPIKGAAKGGAHAGDPLEIIAFFVLGNAFSAISPEFVGIIKSLKNGSGIWRTNAAKYHHVAKSLVRSDSLSQGASPQEGVPCTDSDLSLPHRKMLRSSKMQLFRGSLLTFHDLWRNHRERVYNFTGSKPVFRSKREVLFAWLLRRR